MTYLGHIEADDPFHPHYRPTILFNYRDKTLPQALERPTPEPADEADPASAPVAKPEE